MIEVCTALNSGPYSRDKTHKLGMNGVTKLKDGGFFQRYGQGARHEHQPNGLIVRKPASVRKDTLKKNHAKLLPVGKNLEDIQQNGKKEERSYTLNKKKLRERIMVYVDCMRRSRKWKYKELFFWTVTFPKGTEDDVCYRLLNTWLTTLRQKNMLHSYLWVAERQPSTGTIHFHMLIPHRMDAKIANRHMMISICTMVRKGLLNWNLASAKRYNGVDIHKDRKNKRATNFLEKKRTKLLAYYITKYISKNPTEMKRLCWNSSVDWSVPFRSVQLTREELLTVVNNPEALIVERMFENDYVQFWPWRWGPPARFLQHLCDVNTFLLEDYFLQIGKMDIFFN